MNPRILIISALAVSVFATSVPQFARASSAQISQMSEGQRDELLQAEIYKRMEGGMNSGGGNSIQGKVIESYRIDYKKLKGYGVTNSILERLNNSLPDFTRDLQKQSDKKVWFLVPAEFSTIPRAISGIPANSEQTALNRPLAVWLSKPNLATKSNEQVGILVLHEMVMNYLRSRHINDTNELIEKTQVITALLLDVENHSDLEIAKRVNDLSYNQYESVTMKSMKSELRHIFAKFSKDRDALCNKYQIQSLAKKFSEKKLSPQEDANYLQGLRSITKLQLQLVYPTLDQESSELASIARNNKIYKSELEGIRLSDKYENGVFVNALSHMGNSGMAGICKNGCVSEQIDSLREAFRIRDADFIGLSNVCNDAQAKKPDQYGW